MTIPCTGPINTTDIASEFGGGHPNAISEYFRGLSAVRDTPATQNIPRWGTGPISWSDFRCVDKSATTFSDHDIMRAAYQVHGIDANGRVLIPPVIHTAQPSGNSHVEQFADHVEGVLEFDRDHLRNLGMDSGLASSITPPQMTRLTSIKFAPGGMAGTPPMFVVEVWGNGTWTNVNNQLGIQFDTGNGRAEFTAGQGIHLDVSGRTRIRFRFEYPT